MQLWKKLLIATIPAFVITAFAVRVGFPEISGGFEMASETDGMIADGDNAAIEAALNRIQRAQGLNEVMSRGPRTIKFTAVAKNGGLEGQKADEVRVAPAEPPKRPANAQIPKRETSAGLNVAPATECTSCKKNLSDLQYMQCNRRNNYLENELESLRASRDLVGELLRSGAKGNTVIKPICLQAAMESRYGERNSSAFRSCEEDDDRAATRAYRPCISEDYFTLMNNSFDLVSRCLSPQMGSTVADQKRDIKEAFAMFTWESGMHLNAMSPTGAGGPGQMTSAAIASINKNELPRIRAKLKALGGQCARIATEVLAGDNEMRSSSRLSCDRISLSRKNPMLNFVYSYAALIQGKRLVTEDVFEEPRLRSRFNLSAADLQKLKTALSIWGHNTGSAGLKVPLLALLNSEYRSDKVTDVDEFLSELGSAMRSYPHSANRGSGRRSETSSYYPGMQKVLRGLERNAGGGSCLTQ